MMANTQVAQVQATQDMAHSHINVLNYKGEHAAIGGIGIIHGLASNDELLLLLTLSLGLANFLDIFIGLVIFTLGVVIGMITFSLVLKLPFSEFGQEKVLKWTNVTISLLTLTYGIYVLAGGETLNILPINPSQITGGLYVIALILGIKHSMDADHVVAISSLLLRSDSALKSVTLSMTWALGHMVTASIITFILYTFRKVVLSYILMRFETIVGIMLVTIALLTLAWEFDIINWGKHSHGHQHEDGTMHHNH